ncbi:Predicted phosphoribosyltransferase [Halogranum amylolyticum]|uniref:Predicted phosphoribosyltransferase n=1 Tax=Halogranum amylolyticum TaxID=660520 RepID=A0A1H8W996_9EURY|nr:phosphoribosyltransferase family protein [Halogranum amylolyticum]SEP24232.1 Predicted phosphoribosyltransferase [Halogranum amylolyticum]
MFRNRTDAGSRLASLLREKGIEADVVLAIPRGGLPVGRAVADTLGVPLDVVAARKIGAPSNPELAIGAVASDGTVWLNDSIIDSLDVGDEYVERKRAEEAEAAADKLERYRRDRPPLDLEGKSVLVVDDGVATGATTTACLRQVRDAGAERTILAVPVAPPDTVRKLEDEADEVVCVETPQYFGAVGAFYDDFRQVSDAEAMSYLSDDETGASA